MSTEKALIDTLSQTIKQLAATNDKLVKQLEYANTSISCKQYKIDELIKEVEQLKASL